MNSGATIRKRLRAYCCRHQVGLHLHLCQRTMRCGGAIQQLVDLLSHVRAMTHAATTVTADVASKHEGMIVSWRGTHCQGRWQYCCCILASKACAMTIPPGSPWRTRSLGPPQWHQQGKLPGRSRSRCTWSCRCHTCAEVASARQLTPVHPPVNKREVHAGLLLPLMALCRLRKLIVPRGLTAPVFSLLCLNGDCLRWTYLHKQHSVPLRGEREGADAPRVPRTASQSLQAMHRSSPVGYRRSACSPLNRGLIAPFSKG
jgi:hypothetical protein